MTYGSPNDGWQNPGPGAIGANPYGGQQYSQNSQATTALIVSIVSLLCCALASPVGLYLGKKEVAAIDQGLVDPAERGKAQAAYIIGIIGTVFMVLAIIGYILLFVIAAASSA